MNNILKENTQNIFVKIGQNVKPINCIKLLIRHFDTHCFVPSYSYLSDEEISIFQIWCHLIRIASYNNGACLNEQQLTKNEVPVIVEKCINFIYLHGENLFCSS